MKEFRDMDMDMEGELILITKGAADCEVCIMRCVHCNVFCAVTFCLIPHNYIFTEEDAD